MTALILLCGVDEAGRGPLVGAVVAGALVLPAGGLEGLRDSKKLSAIRREALYRQILQHAQYGIGEASPAEIDEMNILQATMLAMRRAVQALSISGLFVQVDGNRLPDLTGLEIIGAEAIVKADTLIPSVSAASILAKVTRDHQMKILDAEFPQYGFAEHQGYPTPRHLEALRVHGPCPHHRKSFRPVRELLG